MRQPTRLVVLAAALLATLAGCSLFEEGEEEEGNALPPDMARRADGKTASTWPTSLAEAAVKKRIVRLIPAYAKDRQGWADDLHTAFRTLEVPHATQTYCATIAIIEQESGFQADPSAYSPPKQPPIPKQTRHLGGLVFALTSVR